MSKILGMDYGERRIGLALSSEDGQYAFSYQTLENTGKLDLFSELASICRKEDIKVIVIGLPLNQEGTVGKEAMKVQQFSHELKKYLEIPVEFEDERFSSAMASQLFRESGRTVKETKGTIDQKSAQLILQTYLDRKNARLSSH